MNDQKDKDKVKSDFELSFKLTAGELESGRKLQAHCQSIVDIMAQMGPYSFPLAARIEHDARLIDNIKEVTALWKDSFSETATNMRESQKVIDGCRISIDDIKQSMHVMITMKRDILSMLETLSEFIKVAKEFEVLKQNGTIAEIIKLSDNK